MKRMSFSEFPHLYDSAGGFLVFLTSFPARPRSETGQVARSLLEGQNQAIPEGCNFLRPPETNDFALCVYEHSG
jgi:hypothetical protein